MRGATNRKFRERGRSIVLQFYESISAGRDKRERFPNEYIHRTIIGDHKITPHSVLATPVTVRGCIYFGNVRETTSTLAGTTARERFITRWLFPRLGYRPIRNRTLSSAVNSAGN